MEEGEADTGHTALGQGRQEGSSIRGWRRQGGPTPVSAGQEVSGLGVPFLSQIRPSAPSPCRKEALPDCWVLL